MKVLGILLIVLALLGFSVALDQSQREFAPFSIPVLGTVFFGGLHLLTYKLPGAILIKIGMIVFAGFCAGFLLGAGTVNAYFAACMIVALVAFFIIIPRQQTVITI